MKSNAFRGVLDSHYLPPHSWVTSNNLDSLRPTLLFHLLSQRSDYHLRRPLAEGTLLSLVPPPTPLSDTRPVFAVSLLADPPPFPKSSTVLGWLPAETPGDDHEAGLNDFVQNSRFLPILHEAISSGLAEAVDDIQFQILAGTYQAMPSYRVCTAHGVTQLTEGLASKLRTLLDARAREESARNPR
ncbi:hypothetical protein EI94DRAFT_1798580 [Lactarius quietus]|nr:hypothetical protein EI94DRAFT_1798580 [Lactarius quietus]